MANSTFKGLILITSFFLATTSLALAVSLTPQSPNLYILQGNDLRITYSTTSFDGKPQLNYDDGITTKSFRGDEIRKVGTELGTLVSVTIRTTVNSGSTTFTILIPQINLDSTMEANIKTESIITRHKAITPSSLNYGQLDSYKLVVLSGTASLVYF
ncbi:hypothetical protein C8R34_10174 [Nitrosomonas sp. Nm84]|uniref:hypothetical protein n=1 Tax=Nitrosomonas sp. Nm84 TaxID=200124 RepID=UPI000D761ED0|nr:hypothetical protein [Nitrosomonas sp. Nm84]PXW91165.1 hypothetical protein C8R34_10174 [Nitrosomonas sp. Nm84]